MTTEILDSRTRRLYGRICQVAFVVAFAFLGLAYLVTDKLLIQALSLIALLAIAVAVAFRIAERGNIRIWRSKSAPGRG